MPTHPKNSCSIPWREWRRLIFWCQERRAGQPVVGFWKIKDLASGGRTAENKVIGAVGFGITLKGLDTMAWLAGWNLGHSEPRDGDVWASFSGARWLHHLVTCHSYLRKVFLITRNTDCVLQFVSKNLRLTRSHLCP